MARRKWRLKPTKKCKKRNSSKFWETKFADMAKSFGYEVQRHGWPDFIIFKDDEIIAVEVKSFRDRLSEKQIKVINLLNKFGIKSRVWWAAKPNKLLEVETFLKEVDKPENRFLPVELREWHKL